MVVIGHSMGGCIGRLLITDTGDKLWREIFQKPPGETAMPPESKALLTRGLIFHHRPEIGRVIFIAAPLRGSELARNWVGGTGSMLVKVPRKLQRGAASCCAWVGVLVGEHRSLRGEHRERREVLGRDQLDGGVLPFGLAADQPGDLGIRLLDRGARRSLLALQFGDLVDAALVTATLEAGGEPRVEDLVGEALGHDPRPDRQHVRIVVTA